MGRLFLFKKLDFCKIEIIDIKNKPHKNSTVMVKQHLTHIVE